MSSNLKQRIEAINKLDENGFLPCRKCGSTDFDLWEGLGTQAEMGCNDCGEMDGIQVSDLLTQEERYSGHHDFSMETFKWPPITTERAERALRDEWNKRDNLSIINEQQRLLELMAAKFKELLNIPLNISGHTDAVRYQTERQVKKLIEQALAEYNKTMDVK